MNFKELPWVWRFGPGALAIASFLASAFFCLGEDVHLDSAGARFGFYPWGAGHEFHQAEAFANLNLPWNWDLGSLWRLQSRVDISAGWLGEPGADAAIATLGPSVSFGKQRSPISLDCGVSPTLLTRSEFRTKDFGMPFQFTSHGGINFDVSARIRLTYRFQHMSNASLAPHNPGLNLNMLGLSYIF